MGVLEQPVPRMTKFANITMTMPAFLVILFATILFVVTALGAIFAKSPMLLLTVIVMYAFAVYTTYVVNCLTVGNCNLLAWVLAILYAIMVGLTILAYIGAVFTKGFSSAALGYKPKTGM
jgi:hypothetical protein